MAENIDYQNVIVRFLRQDEQLFSSESNNFPLIIEAQNEKSIHFLYEFLSHYSFEIRRDIDRFGAVLLRGFHITNSEEFQSAVLSIQGFNGIKDRFMSTDGRDLVDGLDFVFQPSTISKTGGTYYLGAFHHESFYLPDPPHFVSFFCLNPAKLGGETGLVHTANLYEKLDNNLKTQLESQPFFVRKWPILSVIERYQKTVDQVLQLCAAYGLEVDNDQCIVMHKPCVLMHPINKRKMINANLSVEIPNLDYVLAKNFSKDYKGKEWLLHLLLWKYPFLMKFYNYFATDLPHQIFKFKKMQFLQPKYNKTFITHGAIEPLSSLGMAFSPTDIIDLAGEMKNHYVSSLWQPGDVLLVDNTQVAHAGMPGRWGLGNKRIIRTMVCNPLKLDYRRNACGVQLIQEKNDDFLVDNLNKS